VSGGLRLRPSIRVARLERQAAEREPGLEGLSAPERLWRRALELARSGEVEELDRLVEIASAQEPKTLELLETMLEVWALKERIMARSSPSLAAEYRAERDLPHRGLRTLEERVAQEQERWTPVRRAGSPRLRRWRTYGPRSRGPSNGGAARSPRLWSTARPLCARGSWGR
jgi:hypothetical protein